MCTKSAYESLFQFIIIQPCSHRYWINIYPSKNTFTAEKGIIRHTDLVQKCKCVNYQPWIRKFCCKRVPNVQVVDLPIVTNISQVKSCSAGIQLVMSHTLLYSVVFVVMCKFSAMNHVFSTKWFICWISTLLT